MAAFVGHKASRVELLRARRARAVLPLSQRPPANVASHPIHQRTWHLNAPQGKREFESESVSGLKRREQQRRRKQRRAEGCDGGWQEAGVPTSRSRSSTPLRHHSLRLQQSPSPSPRASRTRLRRQCGQKSGQERATSAVSATASSISCSQAESLQ